jgi:hypothetical protein
MMAVSRLGPLSAAASDSPARAREELVVVGCRDD